MATASTLRSDKRVRVEAIAADDDLFQPFRVVKANGIVTVYDVPLVDSHLVFADDGKFVCECDDKMLRWIAANNNKRMKETGDAVPVILGHTKDDVPEEDQPPIVGESKDFYVAPLMNAVGESTGRNAIYARTTTFTEQDVEKYDLKRFPRRSVEIWFDKDPIIDPIALLGASTPERDLGLMRLKRKGTRYRYSLNAVRLQARRTGGLKKKCRTKAA